MWKATVGMTKGDDLTVVSSTEPKWGVNRNDDVLFVFGMVGEYPTELIVPMDFVRFAVVERVVISV